MANLNNIDGVISTTNTQILASGLKLPPNFNNSRSPNELQSLINYDGNTKTLYNKYGFKTVPKAQTPINTDVIGSIKTNFDIGKQDIVRITKFTTSNAGRRFLTNQLLLQGLNAFNETKIYNPAMPIVAASANALPFVQAPTRFIEPNLGGVMGGLGLSGVSSFLGLSDKPTAPVGTVANDSGGGIFGGFKSIVNSFTGKDNSSDVLPTWESRGVKGLIRGRTAQNAYKNFQDRWGNPSGGGKGPFKKLLNNVKEAAIGFIQSTAIGGLFPVGQPSNTRYKMLDQAAYGTMLENTSNGLFKGTLTNGFTFEDIGDYKQKYTAGKGIGGYNESYWRIVFRNKSNNIENSPIKIYWDDWQNDKLQTKNGFKPNTDSTFNESPNTDLSIQTINDQLANILKSVKQPEIAAAIKTAPYIATSYKELMNIKSHDDFVSGKSPNNYSGEEDKGAISYSKYMKNNKNLLTKKGIDTNVPDSINLLEIVQKKGDKYLDNNNREYVAYGENSSDLIAFHFYDVVNDKYIPFRATVKNIQESLQAEWSDVKYINRADKIYTYGGFGRTLNFNFTVVITSIKELMPTWKRINYLAGLVKPANYTDGTIYSRFVIPPLVKMTIGDIYKEQPALITQVGINIPDDAIWETSPEILSKDKDKFYEYLNGRIVWTKSQGKYAQFPNQCDISINMNLLEKEMPRTGGSNFGDYYLDRDFNELGSSGENSFSKNLYIEKSVKQNDTITKSPTPTERGLGSSGVGMGDVRMAERY